MTPRRGAWMLAAGRTALGVAVLASPERVTSGWLGEDSARLPVVGDLARSLGARDIALGIATLQTLDDPLVGPRVQFACALVDCADVLATVIARGSLPRKGFLGTVVVAAGAAGAGFYFSHALARDSSVALAGRVAPARPRRSRAGGADQPAWAVGRIRISLTSTCGGCASA